MYLSIYLSTYLSKALKEEQCWLVCCAN